MVNTPIQTALRRHRILKELLRREREYTKGYVSLNRLYDIGVLDKGAPGEPHKVAQIRLDELDQLIDALGFLDIAGSFEVQASQRIAHVINETKEKIFDSQLPTAAPGLLREPSDYEKSLRAILKLIKHGNIVDDHTIDVIVETRNAIAHGRNPPAVPLPHKDLAELFQKMIDQQLFPTPAD